MVKTLNTIFLFLLFCLPSFALQRVSGYCSQGGVQGQIQFSNAVVFPKFQASYPGCTINVYAVGTTTRLTIYSDTNSTPKTNPFAADSHTGYWFFYVDGFASPQVDVNLSGAGISTPFTLTMESGGGASGNVNTTGNMVNGNVPKSTGPTTITDGGQAYPVGPFADTTSVQTFLNKSISGNLPVSGTILSQSFTVGGSTVSTPSTISLITPTLTGVTDMFRVALNNCPSSLEYGNGAIPILQGIVGCTRAPDNSTLGGVSTGISFYSFGGGGTANTPVVGAFGFGAPGSVSNVYIGGFNGAVTNALLGTGTGLAVPLFASELDINTASTGAAPFLAHGLAIVSAATQQPTNAFDALDCRISIGISLPFNQCLTSEPGAATEGVRLWPLASTASNSASQPIVLVARNSGGDYSTSKFYLDAAGSYQFFTAGGNFVLNPASSVVTNSASPELTFSSYSSGGTLYQGGMFLDAFGNINVKPSTATFAQTTFLNGAGVAVAQVNPHSFQLQPVSADPGCTTSGQVGSFWLDPTTTPGTTLFKICKSVSSTIGWSVITTTP